MLKAFFSIKSTIIICLTLFIVGLSIIRDYGVSVDEPTYILNVKYNYDYIQNKSSIPIDLKHYGIVFDTFAESVFQTKQIFEKNFKHNPLTDNQLLNNSDHFILSENPQILFDRIKVKHLLTFLSSFLAYITSAIAVGTIVGKKYAWIGIINLALLPRFWGHSFFNPRDIPFACSFTIMSVIGATIISFSFDKSKKINFKYLVSLHVLTGLGIGLVTGIRTGGFFLLVFIPLTDFFISLSNKKLSYKTILNKFSCYLCMFVAWTITTTIIHPASWSNPIKWFIDTLEYLSQHGWSYTVLFEGQQIEGSSVPWYYLIKWFLITTPIIFLLLFFVSLIFIIFKYKNLSVIQKSLITLFLLQIFTLPAIAILKGSTLYDGIRHFLFVLPPVAILNSITMVWIYKLIKTQKRLAKSLQIFFSTFYGVACLTIIVDMYQLHPYEYIYFNRLSGGLEKLHDRFETDYWGLSLFEATKWLNKNLETKNKIYSSNSFLYQNQASTNLDFNFNAQEHKDLQLQKLKNLQLYYVALPRWDFHQRFPSCPVEKTIARQNVPLTLIKKCNL